MKHICSFEPPPITQSSGLFLCYVKSVSWIGKLSYGLVPVDSMQYTTKEITAPVWISKLNSYQFWTYLRRVCHSSQIIILSCCLLGVSWWKHEFGCSVLVLQACIHASINTSFTLVLCNNCFKHILCCSFDQTTCCQYFCNLTVMSCFMSNAFLPVEGGWPFVMSFTLSRFYWPKIVLLIFLQAYFMSFLQCLISHWSLKPLLIFFWDVWVNSELSKPSVISKLSITHLRMFNYIFKTKFIMLSGLLVMCRANFTAPWHWFYKSTAGKQHHSFKRIFLWWWWRALSNTFKKSDLRSC